MSSNKNLLNSPEAASERGFTEPISSDYTDKCNFWNHIPPSLAANGVAFSFW